MKDFFLEEIRKRGGFECHHAHFDKAYLINPQNFKRSTASLQEKWKIYREFKENYTIEDLVSRMSRCVDNLLEQKTKYIKTFVDADLIVGQKCIDAALILKDLYSSKVEIDIGIQPLEGLEDKKCYDNFVLACKKADFIGGLPDRDTSPIDHVKKLIFLSKELNKSVDIHVGQNNIPTEKETEMVLDVIEELKPNKKISLVHCISLSCQEEDYIVNQAKRMKNLGVDVIVCPSAAISMKQNNSAYAPVHNSIAPVEILLNQNVNVKLGIDNISDLFMPLVDGDLWFETRLLMEATRIYDFEKIIKIVS